MINFEIETMDVYRRHSYTQVVKRVLHIVGKRLNYETYPRSSFLINIFTPPTPSFIVVFYLNFIASYSNTLYKNRNNDAATATSSIQIHIHPLSIRISINIYFCSLIFCVRKIFIPYNL